MGRYKNKVEKWVIILKRSRKEEEEKEEMEIEREKNKSKFLCGWVKMEGEAE